ncbi:hypothetical protein H2198_003630 [Neophaeococcomyces mojaviensis]|uniref:Uncharacterized protein n=1 Tax=Neophaeococcomyces mojaviensis TaxID=3383035 RepID=A0ACC3AAZ0_9EURO|nr:hypothetical protein H2198_003630 [Knufia sp. JES_112]
MEGFVVQAPNHFTVPRPPEVVNDLLHSPFLQPAMTDSLLCHSILAVSAAAETAIPDPTMNVLALTLLDQAMTLLRQRVAIERFKLEDNTIIAAIYLWKANLSLADRESLKGHASSIRALVATREGVEKLGMSGAVAQLLRWTDIMHSLRVHEPCQYTILDEIPGRPQADVNHYGTYWRQDAQLMPTSDRTIIKACQDCCFIIETLELHESERMEPALYWYLYQKTCQVFQQSSTVRAKYYDSGNMEECIILTIDLLKLLIFKGGYMQPDRWDIRSLCSGIVEAVKSTGPSNFWQKHMDVLIWIMFVVRAAEHDSEEQEWARKVLKGALQSKFGYRESWLNDWQNELRTLLASFGWSHTVLSDGIHAMCIKIFG